MFEVRKKLIKIINTESKNTLSPYIECRIADAIIESGLLKDEKVYMPVEQEITIPQAVCPKCGYFVGGSCDVIQYTYCPGCGVRLTNRLRNHNA